MAEFNQPLKTFTDLFGWNKKTQEQNPDSLAEQESAKTTLLKLLSLAEQFRNRNVERGDVYPAEIEVSIIDSQGNKKVLSVPEQKVSPAGFRKPEVRLTSIVVRNAKGGETTERVTIRQWPQSGQILVSYTAPNYIGKLEQQTFRDSQGNDIVLMTPTEAEKFLPQFKKIEQLLTQATTLNNSQEFQAQTASASLSPEAVEFRAARNRLESERASNVVIAQAYKLYEKFEAQQGFTSGKDEVYANEQSIVVSYNNKEYKIMVPRCSARLDRDSGKPTSPFEINVTLTEVSDNATKEFIDLTFEYNPEKNNWIFSSNKTPNSVDSREATRFDTRLKFAGELLTLAVDQAEKKLRENPNYKAEERQADK